MQKPKKPPIDNVLEFKEDFLLASAIDAKGRYLPWDELRRKHPTPHGWTHEKWWALTKLARTFVAEPVPVMSEHYGTNVRFVLTDAMKRQLHRLDRNPSTKLLLPFIDDPEVLDKFRIRELVEEAIDSSMIEGARPTTRDAARQMLREGRAATSRDERMIVNNWQAMKWLLALRDRGGHLDMDGLLELHRVLGEDALACERPAGQFREHEEITVSDMEGDIWHVAPPREGLEARVEALLRFAQPEEEDAFVHPVVRAVIAHFWLGYEHPFCDGNGRVARALYYWVMLSNGYEIAEFLSISGAIRDRGTQYYRAFAYCEAEGLDLTYFLVDQFASIEAALQKLIERLNLRKSQLAKAKTLLPGLGEINSRQRALVESALRHPLRRYTIKDHGASHSVSYLTARKDLMELESRGLMTVQRVGTANHYRLADKLHKATLK